MVMLYGDELEAADDVLPNKELDGESVNVDADADVGL